MKPASPSNRILRVSLVLAIICGLGAAALNLSWLRQEITRLRAKLDSETLARAAAQAESDHSRKELARTNADLLETREALATSHATHEEAVAVGLAHARRAEKAAASLAQMLRERDAAQAELARYRAAGLEPEQIIAAATRVKDLQARLSATEKQKALLDRQLKRWIALASDVPPPLPAGLRAKVVASDPKWNFLVLDAGQDKGVLERGELLLSRGGKLVAKAKVGRVEANRCIIDPLPGWQFADALEGDLAIPASPAFAEPFGP